MSRKITILEQSFKNLLLPLNSDENRRRFASALSNIFKTLNEFHNDKGKKNSYINLVNIIKTRTLNNIARNISSPDDFAVLQTIFNEILGAYGRNLDNDEMRMTNAYIQEITQEMLQSLRPATWPSTGPSILTPGIMPRPSLANWPSTGPSIPNPEMIPRPTPVTWQIPSLGPKILTADMMQNPRPATWPRISPSIPTPEMMQSPTPATWQRASKDDPAMAPGQPMPPLKSLGKSKRKEQQEETTTTENKNTLIGKAFSKINSFIQRFFKKEDDDYAVYFPPLSEPYSSPEIIRNPRHQSTDNRVEFRRSLIIPFDQLGIKNPSLIKNCTFHTINGTTYYKTERGMVEVHGTDFEKY